jgi:hypothetical protein
VDFAGLDIRASSRFIIGRLMEHGDETGMRFLLDTFRREELAQVVRTGRAISGRSRAFWRVILDMDEEACTPKRYPSPYGNCLET